MAEGGFYEQKRLSPTGLTAVVAMHAAALAAVVLIKGPGFLPPPDRRTEVTFVPLPPPPDPQPQPQPKAQPQRQRTQIDTPPRIVETPPRGPVVLNQPLPPQPWTNTPPGNEIVIQPQPQPLPPPPPPPPPQRVVEAARARGSLQGLFRPDDYPVAAADAGDQGSTGVRLTVGADGRVANCSIIRSSGSRVLDAATCRVLRSRARYTPARDQNNQPTTDTQSATITWRLSD